MSSLEMSPFSFLPLDVIHELIITKYIAGLLSEDDMDRQPLASFLIPLQFVSKQFYQAILRPNSLTRKAVLNYRYLRVRRFARDICRSYGSLSMFQWLRTTLRFDLDTFDLVADAHAPLVIWGFLLELYAEEIRSGAITREELLQMRADQIAASPHAVELLKLITQYSKVPDGIVRHAIDGGNLPLVKYLYETPSCLKYWPKGKKALDIDSVDPPNLEVYQYLYQRKAIKGSASDIQYLSGCAEVVKFVIDTFNWTPTPQTAREAASKGNLKLLRLVLAAMEEEDRPSVEDLFSAALKKGHTEMLLWMIRDQRWKLPKHLITPETLAQIVYPDIDPDRQERPLSASQELETLQLLHSVHPTAFCTAMKNLLNEYDIEATGQYNTLLNFSLQTWKFLVSLSIPIPPPQVSDAAYGDSYYTLAIMKYLLEDLHLPCKPIENAHQLRKDVFEYLQRKMLVVNSS